MFSLGDYRPQERIETDSFIVRKLEPADVHIDYAAAASSVNEIKRQRGGTWPPSTGFTVEQNLADLIEHEHEFATKSSFAYIVTTLDGKESLGCIYFYPVGHPMNSAAINVPPDADAVVNMWVTKSAFNNGFYNELYRFIEEWIPQWPFKNPYFSNPLKPD